MAGFVYYFWNFLFIDYVFLIIDFFIFFIFFIFFFFLNFLRRPFGNFVRGADRLPGRLQIASFSGLFVAGAGLRIS